MKRNEVMQILKDLQVGERMDSGLQEIKQHVGSPREWHDQGTGTQLV